jgi:hypothetical protein
MKASLRRRSADRVALALERPLLATGDIDPQSETLVGEIKPQIAELAQA